MEKILTPEGIILNRKKWLAANSIQDWTDADTVFISEAYASQFKREAVEQLELSCAGMSDTLYLFSIGDEGFAVDAKQNWTLDFVKKRAKETLEEYYYNEPIKPVKSNDVPIWYTKDGMKNHLLNNNYSKEIAEELSQMFADGFQSSFKKGWEKGYNDFNPNKSTDNYKYFEQKSNDVGDVPELFSMPVGIASEWFAEQRKTSGLTLREVEEKTGISNSYLSQLETGKVKEPSYSTVTKLNKLYNPDSEKEMENYHNWKNSAKQKSIDVGDVEKAAETFMVHKWNDDFFMDDFFTVINYKTAVQDSFKAGAEWQSKQQPVKSEQPDEILNSLSEMIRTVSRAINMKEFVKDVDLPRLENAKNILAKYSIGEDGKLIQSEPKSEQPIDKAIELLSWLTENYFQRMPNGFARRDDENDKNRQRLYTIHELVKIYEQFQSLPENKK